MIDRGKILVLDEPHIIEMVRAIAESCGCDVIGLSKADFIEEVIQRHHVKVLVLANEMRNERSVISGAYKGSATQPDRCLLKAS